MASKLFAQMKKQREETLTSVVNAAKGGKFKQDERLWQPTKDKSGNGWAVIRFLPPPSGEKSPFVTIYSHGFSGPTGKWYIENCLSTKGQGTPDPINESNSALWATGDEAMKKIVSGDNGKNARKRKTSYYANVLVVKDPAHPENEGKVFLYRFGTKIFGKIMDKLEPKFESDEKVIVYDFLEGANFKLKIKTVNKQVNYDDSEWETPSQVLKGDETACEALWNQEYSLNELISDDKFKSYDDLKAHFINVVGESDPAVQLMGWGRANAPKQSSAPTKSVDAPAPSAVATARAGVAVEETEEDDDASAFFKQLNSGD